MKKSKLVPKFKIDKIPLRLVISGQSGAFIVDFRKRTAKQFYEIERGGLWGITWFDQKIFFASHELVKSNIHILDTKGKFVKKFSNRNPPFGFSHQISFAGRELWVTDTLRDGVQVFTKSGKSIRSHYDEFVLPDGKTKVDAAHVNSIFDSDDRVYFLCHMKNSPPSLLMSYDKKKKTFQTEWSAGSEAHNVIPYDDQILISSSLDCTVIDREGKIYADVSKDHTFLRGVAMTENYIVLAGSQWATHTERFGAGGTAHLYVFDTKWKPIGSVALKGDGQIHDVRALDVFDFAHNQEPISLTAPRA